MTAPNDVWVEGARVPVHLEVEGRKELRRRVLYTYLWFTFGIFFYMHFCRKPRG